MKNFRKMVNYVRISVTDNCNLRCQYCVEEDEKCGKNKDQLSPDDIKVLVQAFALMGVKKIRLTGGEPTIRTDIEEIIEKISSVEDIESIALTTNGLKLSDRIENFYKKGVRGINISLDTLNPEKYRDITRGGELHKVIDLLEKASQIEGLKIKINAVLMKGINEDEIPELAGLAEKYGADVRFIELMPIGAGKGFTAVLKEEILEKLSMDSSNLMKKNSVLDGPAKYFYQSSSGGRVGYISSVSQEFCSSCNRIRVTSTGFLKLCLHLNKGILLKPYLEKGYDAHQLKEVIEEALKDKKGATMGRKIKKEEAETLKMYEIGG
ncbi:MAG: GTP 3',8-cyclase MoaA [Fusobacteriaceae bacterium]